MATLTVPCFSRDCPAENYAAQDVKVAFIYNLAKFISLPGETSGQPIIIGILGKNPFGPALKNIKDKTIRGRTIEIRQVLTPQEARQCQLLFISESEKNRLQKWLIPLSSFPTLTISDIPGFVDQDGMLELIEIDQRIRFAVNLDEIHRSHLSLDAQLLNLAYRVRYLQRVD